MQRERNHRFRLTDRSSIAAFQKRRLRCTSSPHSKTLPRQSTSTAFLICVLCGHQLFISVLSVCSCSTSRIYLRLHGAVEELGFSGGEIDGFAAVVFQSSQATMSVLRWMRAPLIGKRINSSSRTNTGPIQPNILRPPVSELPGSACKHDLITCECQHTMLALMAPKTISGRQLRHGTPEEALSPGQAVRVKKRDGKLFELRRLDSGGRDILADLDRILEEIPQEGPASKTDLARIIIEGRE